MARVKKQVAVSILSEVEGDKRFFANDGKVLSQLKDVPSALRKMNKETFSYHVNAEKNDLANWVNDVLGDAQLAKKMRDMSKKSEMSKAVGERVKSLEKMR